jgi:tetratricopeptide (TPR) repeat protein
MRALPLIPAVFIACAGQQRPSETLKTANNESFQSKTASQPDSPNAPAGTVHSLAIGALLFEDLGTFHRPIGTSSPSAQAFFDQGLRLAYGFNHDEAARSFAKAAELDRVCAICFWGVSLTLGPNYNVPMLPDRAQAAWDALTRARALASRSTTIEQALIAALAKRYKGPEPLDPSAQQPFNESYANAMRELAHAHPDDLDVQVLFAEALMDANPWKLWTLDGKPAPQTEEIVATLESVLARDPNHPGANHYYIHAVEASPHPEKAIAPADRLGKLMPGAGHIVHMPAHIYQRVGRYADATEVNRKAVEVDHRYMAKTTPPGYYAMYLGHNYGFLAYAAAMEGRAAESLQSARDAVKALPPEMLEMMPGMDFFASEQLLVMVRFGMWETILAEPKPPEKYKVLTALWLHARGMAYASTGKLSEADTNLAALKVLREGLTGVAAKAIEARISERRGNYQDAIALWKEAVAMEDGLAYSEPADWFYPLRHYLGAALIEAKRMSDAESVYRRDLEKNPKNGWALFGLWQCLKAQGRKRDAAQVEKEFRSAWKRADIRLARSAF